MPDDYVNSREYKTMQRENKPRFGYDKLKDAMSDKGITDVVSKSQGTRAQIMTDRMMRNQGYVLRSEN